MLIDFSLFRRCGPGRNDADRFFLARHMHNKEQSRALGVSNCSFSCFVLGGCVHQAEERVEEDLAGFLEIYIVLAQIDGCLLGVPYKGLPAQLKPSVHELQCIYIACTRQAAYLLVCATRNVRRRHTFLKENDRFGIVDPALLPSTTDNLGNPCLDALTNTAVSGTPCAVLLPIDLTRGGSQFTFLGRTDVKEISLYLQDTITKGNWSFNLGMRGDLYRGLSSTSQAEPRLGIAYNIKPTSTVLRVSYARTLETPFNENLVIATRGCNVDVIAALIPCVPANSPPGFRNEFHAGLQQAFGKYLVIDAECLWKYTHNAYDFSVLGNTPITFPIDWHNSKIPGFALRASVPNFHGLTALVVMSSVAARYFPPQVGGLGVTVGQSGSVFRIDHDEKFNSTAHVQYQPWKRGPWVGFNWRYDSGLVAGAVPDFATVFLRPHRTGLSKIVKPRVRY
jgi:hypothetical protein